MSEKGVLILITLFLSTFIIMAVLILNPESTLQFRLDGKDKELEFEIDGKRQDKLEKPISFPDVKLINE